MGETADLGAGGMLMSPVWDMLFKGPMENKSKDTPFLPKL